MSDPVFSRDVHPSIDFKVKSSARTQEKLAFGRAVDEGAKQAKFRQFVSSTKVAAVLSKKRRSA